MILFFENKLKSFCRLADLLKRNKRVGVELESLAEAMSQLAKIGQELMRPEDDRDPMWRTIPVAKEIMVSKGIATRAPWENIEAKKKSHVILNLCKRNVVFLCSVFVFSCFLLSFVVFGCLCKIECQIIRILYYVIEKIMKQLLKMFFSIYCLSIIFLFCRVVGKF